MTDKFVNRSRLKEVYNSRYFLVIWKPEIVFEAQINQTDFTYPVFDLTFDNVISGAFTAIKPDMTVLLGSRRKGDDLGRGRIRTDATSDTLKVGRSSQGYHDGELNVSDDVFITVLNDYRIWSKIPLIQPDGTMYKDTDIVVNSFHTQLFPVANAGPGVAGFVDEGTGKLRVVLPPYTNTSFAADGSSISYQWVLPTGVTLVGGTLTSPQISVDCDPGRYWVDLEVTDANGHTHIAHVPIAACEPTGEFAPFKEFEITSHTISKRGQNISFRVHESFPEKRYPDGTLVMLWEEEYHNGELTYLAGVSGREHMRFIGWHDTETLNVSGSKTGIKTDSTFSCVDVAGRLASIPSFSQIVIHKNSPSDWTQMYQPNIDKYLHYLLHWHSTALDLADFTWSGKSAYTFTRLGSEGSNLFDQVNKRAEAIIHNLVCDTLGRLKITPNPNLQAEADRTTSSMFDFGEHDYEGVTATRRRHPNTHWIRSGAFIARRDRIQTVYCIAPGYAPGQGVEKQDSNEMLVLSQEELNIREGHRYALKNREILSFNLRGIHANYLGIEPADQEWVQVSLSPKDPRRLHLVSDRFLVDQISISYSTDKKGMRKDVSYTLIPEVIGTPAQTVIYKNNEFYFPRIQFKVRKFPRRKYGPVSWPGWKFGGPGGGMARGISKVGVIGTWSDDVVNLAPYKPFYAITEDFQTPGDAGGPTWTFSNISTLGGTYADGVWVDPYSPLYAGAADNAVRVFAINGEGVYRNNDFFDFPNGFIQVLDTNPVPAGSVITVPIHHSLYFSPIKPGWMLYVMGGNDTPSTRYTWEIYWSKNFGTTWTLGYSWAVNSGSTVCPFLALSLTDPFKVWLFKTNVTNPTTTPGSLVESNDFGQTFTSSSYWNLPSAFENGGLFMPLYDNQDDKLVHALDTGSGGVTGQNWDVRRTTKLAAIENVKVEASASVGGMISSRILGTSNWAAHDTIKIHPYNDNYIYLIDDNQDVAVTKDAGRNWAYGDSANEEEHRHVFTSVNDPDILYLLQTQESSDYVLNFGVLKTGPIVSVMNSDLTWVDDKTGDMLDLLPVGTDGLANIYLSSIFGGKA